jgi:hypothetical protein
MFGTLLFFEANLFCNFLVSRQKFLLLTPPKLLHSCEVKKCVLAVLLKNLILVDVNRFVSFILMVQISPPYIKMGRAGAYVPLLLKISGTNVV